jgi:excisionase family DNA binding protein
MIKEEGTRFLTIAEFARETRRSMAAIYSGIKRGKLPAVRFGQSWLIPVSYLDKLEDEANRSVAPTAAA